MFVKLVRVPVTHFQLKSALVVVVVITILVRVTYIAYSRSCFYSENGQQIES